jgi:hypothetical protein
MSSGASRQKWTCPSCGKVYAIPATANTSKMTVCPRCDADKEEPIIIQKSDHSSVYWTKNGQGKIIVIGSAILTALLFVVMCVGIFANNKTLADDKIRAVFFAAFGSVAIVALILLHFLPSIIAYLRAHRNLVPILILNFCLAWTGIVWILLMVWATMSTVKIETERSI